MISQVGANRINPFSNSGANPANPVRPIREITRGGIDASNAKDMVHARGINPNASAVDSAVQGYDMYGAATQNIVGGIVRPGQEPQNPGNISRPGQPPQNPEERRPGQPPPNPGGIGKPGENPQNPEGADRNGEEPESATQKTSQSAVEELTQKELQILETLKARDTEVRAHEMAHISAGGQHISSGASYEYKRGPDGKRYAVGGEVSIDLSEVPGDPAATITKMGVVKNAALAPKDPSPQDMKVAARATQIEMLARVELATLEQAEAAQSVKMAEAEKVAFENENGENKDASQKSGNYSFNRYSQDTSYTDRGVFLDVSG